MLAESSKSAPKAVLYKGIELVKKVFDVFSVTDGRKSIPNLMLPINLLCERNALAECTKSFFVRRHRAGREAF